MRVILFLALLLFYANAQKLYPEGYADVAHEILSSITLSETTITCTELLETFCDEGCLSDSEDSAYVGVKRCLSEVHPNCVNELLKFSPGSPNKLPGELIPDANNPDFFELIFDEYTFLMERCVFSAVQVDAEISELPEGENVWLDYQGEDLTTLIPVLTDANIKTLVINKPGKDDPPESNLLELIGVPENLVINCPSCVFSLAFDGDETSKVVAISARKISGTVINSIRADTLVIESVEYVDDVNVDLKCIICHINVPGLHLNASFGDEPRFIHGADIRNETIEMLSFDNMGNYMLAFDSAILLDTSFAGPVVNTPLTLVMSGVYGWISEETLLDIAVGDGKNIMFRDSVIKIALSTDSPLCGKDSALVYPLQDQSNIDYIQCVYETGMSSSCRDSMECCLELDSATLNDALLAIDASVTPEIVELHDVSYSVNSAYTEQDSLKILHEILTNKVGRCFLMQYTVDHTTLTLEKLQLVLVATRSDTRFNSYSILVDVLLHNSTDVDALGTAQTNITGAHYIRKFDDGFDPSSFNPTKLCLTPSSVFIMRFAGKSEIFGKLHSELLTACVNQDSLSYFELVNYNTEGSVVTLPASVLNTSPYLEWVSIRNANLALGLEWSHQDFPLLRHLELVNTSLTEFPNIMSYKRVQTLILQNAFAEIEAEHWNFNIDLPHLVNLDLSNNHNSINITLPDTLLSRRFEQLFDISNSVVTGTIHSTYPVCQPRDGFVCRLNPHIEIIGECVACV